MPNSVISIGKEAFENCTSLQNIEIPNSVTTIGRNAFYKCTSLQSIEIPNSITTIEVWTFKDCTALQNIHIPSSVTTIKNDAFKCPALKNIHIRITNIENTDIGKSAFYEVDTENCILHIQPGTLSAIQAHPIWGKFKNIKIASSKDFLSNININEDFIYEETDNIDIDKIYKDAKNFKDFETQYALSDNIKRRIESKKQKERIAILENHTCQVCGFRQPYINSNGKKRYIIEVDHIIEKSKGGGECMENLLVLCPNCHAKKTYGIITIDNNFRVYENGKETKIRDNHLKKHI